MAGILGQQPRGSILGGAPSTILGGRPSFATMYPMAMKGPVPGYVEPYSGVVLPFSKDRYGSVSFDPSAGFLGNIARAVSFPMDAMQGRVDPTSNEGIARAVEAAGIGVGGAGFPRGISEISRASRSARMYNPPVKSPRPFEADYPPGAATDGPGSPLQFDIEGRPIVARHVVGRSVVGGEDIPLAPSQYDAVAEGSIGSVPESVEARALPRGTVGVYRAVASPDGPERSIGVLNSLPPESAAKVVAHEMGHMIDDLAGEMLGIVKGKPVRGIDQAGIKKELAAIYNDLNNPDLAAARARNPDVDPAKARHGTGYAPKHQGYTGEASDRELMAEAVRAYMADPNYIKTVAPKTAAAIRQAVNDNPRLREAIQFNTDGLPIVNTEVAEQRARRYDPDYRPVY